MLGGNMIFYFTATGNSLYVARQLENEPISIAKAKNDGIGKQFTFVDEIENFDEYEVIYIGVPVWWSKLPQPMVSFFESYDFSGKTIIPFGIHLGSRFGSMIDQMKELEPDATILDGFTISADTANDKVRTEFDAFLETVENNL